MCCLRTVCAWSTGLSGAHTPDCPVHQGTAAERLVPGGTRREDHRTVRCKDRIVRCPHAGLSGAPGNSGPTASSRGTRRKDHRTVRCEHRTVRCGKPAAPTVTCSNRATARRTGQATVRCPVHHRTVRCAAENCSFSPTATIVLGAINTPPTGHSQVWEPKQHTKAYCRHFQVLKHPSA